MSGQPQAYSRAPDLPLFERPPVTQVNMGLHLQALNLRAIDLGELYSRFKEFYPVIEEQPPSPLQIEQFTGSSPSVHFQFQLLDRPPLPTLVFFSKDRSSLVQVDSSRFVCAWRRSSADAAYPSYENFRREFLRNLEIFDKFTVDINAASKVITQAEISYINEIPMDDGPRPDILVQRVPDFNQQVSASGDRVTAIGITQHFTYANEQNIEYSRLHISSEPVSTESGQVLRLSLVYRGEPRERFPDMDEFAAATSFLDQGHDRIVRAFAENTTPDAHEAWGRVA